MSYPGDEFDPGGPRSWDSLNRVDLPFVVNELEDGRFSLYNRSYRRVGYAEHPDGPSAERQILDATLDTWADIVGGQRRGASEFGVRSWWLYDDNINQATGSVEDQAALVRTVWLATGLTITSYRNR